MRKKLHTLMLMLGVVGLLAACGGDKEASSKDSSSGASGDKVKLVAATINPAESLLGKALIAFADAINEESNGEIEVTVHTGGRVGDASSIYQSVISGDIDMIYTDTGWFSEHQPIFDVLSSNYLFKDREHFNSIVNESDRLSYFEDLLRENPGLETVMYAGGLERNILSTFPVESVGDLKGKSMRSGGSATEMEWWQRLGASPQNIDLSEVYSAIQTGVVEGTQNSLDSMIENRFGEVGKYVARTQHILTLGFVAMNGDRYNNLSDEHKQAIAAASDRVQSEYTEIAFDEADEYKEKLETEFGLTFTEPDKEEFIKISRDQMTERAKELGAEDVVNDIFE
ncbi:TRAP transporter substrate-binding protein [Sporosarcina cascadiensis]|uniref:TRAP transporter substrate-binding protein n=1 Tax=Sporosarcina cascadiensis TaxID=2660747 RepID=UPI00129AEC70|nr:TRAP transporter substrate-binding protein [Sporosarcina cascadiensis]